MSVSSTSISLFSRAARLVAPVFLVLLVAGLVWTLAFYARLNRATPGQADWVEAARLIAQQARPGDVVAIVPFWATTGERAFVEAGLSYRYVRWVAREDWPGHPRLWVVHAHGRFVDRRELLRAGFTSEYEATAGVLGVERFSVPGGEVATYRFERELSSARVEQLRGKREQPCTPWLADTERFECAPQSTWNYVGRLTREVGFGIRPAIWAHPIQNGSTRIRFENVPLSRRIVVHTALTHHAVALREGAPVLVDVRVNGEQIGRAIQPNERGWFRHEFAYAGDDAKPVRVEFVIHTQNQARRHFAFDAYAQ